MSRHYTVAIDGGSETFTIDRRYRIVRRVGSGAYGTVCSAYDLHADRYCAIKKVNRIFDKRLVTKRCLREIKLLQHFNNHPRIIELFDMDIVDTNAFNEVYLVFNCMDASLHDVIHSDKPLEIVHAQWFLYQMLSGLQYIHAAKVIHRDLKPANILVNQNCDIKICDFGMARGYSPSDGTVPLMTEYVTTRYYRAPEVMISPHNYSEQIDVWSVGCIFGEILGRRVLFKGRDYVDQLHQILAILGLPQDISFWDPSESVISHLQQLCTVDGNPPPSQPVDFRRLFPHSPPDGLDLLQQLLELDPNRRITVTEALNHPFVAPFKDPAEEALRPQICDFSFENDDGDKLRSMIIEEVESFRRHQHRQRPYRHYTTTNNSPDSGPRRPYDHAYRQPNVMSSASMSLLERSGHSSYLQEAESPTGIVSDELVGEPEAMTEEEELMTTTALVDCQRRLKQPAHGPAREELERALSGTWVINDH